MPRSDLPLDQDTPAFAGGGGHGEEQPQDAVLAGETTSDREVVDVIRSVSQGGDVPLPLVYNHLNCATCLLYIINSFKLVIVSPLISILFHVVSGLFWCALLEMIIHLNHHGDW